ncbi:unnamed protein product [Sordaria macrospora k-hell]|uniref:WGS project CABT00000000 data, contig 2.22 n=1 Tax=Sordaria macrospora (strain ATCC MYA-333 / DSM 997 / K(L3346) / K-hell) TaxID=771870 RepID=F7W2K8_SORMK|nr:uncharacterized protein SMAC_05071 [Sordaria macrospora k-hell]CCC11859.1 unnamed protein product [Sordaria macrospora k-hell]
MAGTGIYRNSNSPYANSSSNNQITDPSTPAVSAFTSDNVSEITSPSAAGNHDFAKDNLKPRSRTATMVSAQTTTQSLALYDAVSVFAILPAVPESYSPELAPTNAHEHDGLQPLSTYYIPHEYVDVNGVRNKGFAPVVPGGQGQGLLKLSPADGDGHGLGHGQRVCGLKRSMFVFLVLLAIIIGLGVGLGAGLGMGLKGSCAKNSGTGLGGAGAGGGGGGGACPASPTSTSPSDNSNGNSQTSTSSTAAAPSASSTDTTNSDPDTDTDTNSAVAGIPHLTCPSFNDTIFASPLLPSSSSSSSSSKKKYKILCDTNLSQNPLKQDLASGFVTQTLEECFAVCDAMNFYLKRGDVSAVWNYAWEKGPGRGGCWCVGKKGVEGGDASGGKGNGGGNGGGNGWKVFKENKGVR